ncbi:MAG: fasciclin domain-containing protein [Halioglobus sp.]|nr:fasciclin domain-containing protein [Halioglobus sp.]
MKVTQLLKTVAGASLLIFASASWAGHCGGDHSHDTAAKAKPTIVEVAAGNEDFSTLVAALQAAGLDEVLAGEGPYTVFAPTNEAFAALPAGTVENLLKPENREQLVAVLTYHVVAGAVYAEDVVELDSATTVQGDSVQIAAQMGKVKVDNAQVIATDIEASNGVIHVLDAVILPNS